MARDPDANPMGELLSEICDPHDRMKFFNPWLDVMPKGARRKCFTDLVSRLGPRYARCTLTNFEVYEESAKDTTAGKRPSQREVAEAVQAFSADMPARLRDGGGVVLYGRPGTGKDHLLVALMYEAILLHGWSAKWTTGATLAMRARELIRTGGSETEFIKQYEASHILLISDPVPPKGDASQYAADVMLRIIDRRYRNLKSTWATMNVDDGQEAADRTAAPIVDRLRHGSLALKCNWQSYRSRNGFKEVIQ